jgi:hypothetical protein
MNTYIQQAIDSTYQGVERQASVFSRFITWCKSQEKYRFGWVAAIIAGHGCVITPITLFAIILSGNSILFWAVALGAMTAALVANLAAMPTKITIPIFFLTILIDLTIIAICIGRGFDISSTYVH